MRTQKFYSFNIQDGVVTAAFKYDDGTWKANHLELGERYATDGENVFLVETEHGRSEITSFSLLPGQTNLYSKVGKSYVKDATSLPGLTPIDSVPSAKSQEGIETNESEAHSASHDEAHERTESHVDISSVNASTLESASPLQEESHLTQHKEGIETNESEAHSAHSASHDEALESTESHVDISSVNASTLESASPLQEESHLTQHQEGIETNESEAHSAHSASHDEALESTESHVDISSVNAGTLESASPLHEESHLTQHQEGIETSESEAHSTLHDETHERIESHDDVTLTGSQIDLTVTPGTIKLSHVLTSLKMYLGRLDASTIDPLAWVAVDIDNDGQLTLNDVMSALKGYLGKNQQAATAATATKYLATSDLRDVEGVKKLVASDGAYVDREHIHVRHWDKAQAQLEHVELIGVSMEHLDSYIH